jgi:hypothetical protein
MRASGGVSDEGETMKRETIFTLEEIKQGCEPLWNNVECLTCSRLLAYVKDLLSCIEGRGVEDVWDRLNERRHELINIKRGRVLTNREMEDYLALQGVAGLVRGLKIDQPFQINDNSPIPTTGGESPILVFESWLLRWVADNGRKLTQTEYGIAYAAFIAAHPGEGPKAHVMSTAGGERCVECGHERRYSDNEAGVCEHPGKRGEHSSVVCGHRCVFPAPPEAEASQFDKEFTDWQEKMERSIEATRQSEILTAEDFNIRINARAGDRPSTPVPAETAAQDDNEG